MNILAQKRGWGSAALVCFALLMRVGVYASEPAPRGSACGTNGVLRALDGLPQEVLGEVHPCLHIGGVTPAQAQILLRRGLAVAYDRTTGDIWLLENSSPGRGESAPLAGRLPESLGFLTLPGFLSHIETARPALRAGFPPGIMLRVPSRGPAGMLSGPALPARKSSTSLVLSENFEGSPWSNWIRSDANQGAYRWGSSTCANHTPGGSACADGIRGGTAGGALACDANYPDGVNAVFWTPACLAIQSENQAWLELYHTQLTDGSAWADGMGVWVDVNNAGDAWGWGFWGDWSADWYRTVFNMRQWYKFGDLTSYDCAVLIFGFWSNSSYAVGFGARLDDVSVVTDAPPDLHCAITADVLSGPAPLTVHFQSIVEGAGPGAEYNWWSGEGSAGGSTEPDPTFTYPHPGTFTAEMQVGSMAEFYECIATQAITVTECVPPACADQEAPPDNSPALSTLPLLSWRPPAGATAFDVHFGTQSDPPLVATVTAPHFSPGPLQGGTTYRWEILPKNSCGTAPSCSMRTLTTSAGCNGLFGEDDCSHAPGTSHCCCFVPDHIHDLGQIFPAQSMLRVRYRAGTPLGVCQESLAYISASEDGITYQPLAEERVPARSGVGDTDHTVDFLPSIPFRFIKVSIPVCYNDDSGAKAWCGSEPPFLLTQPADASVRSGQSVTLAVEAMGSPTLQYQWYRGDSGDTSILLPGEISPSFTTPALPSSARYWVRVSNGVGSTDSRTAAVTVTDPTGSLDGQVGVYSGALFLPMDSNAVTGRAILRDESGTTLFETGILNGAFHFASLPVRGFTLVTELDYKDHVLYDASLQDFGCPAPTGNVLYKSVQSRPMDVFVEGPTHASVPFPPPLVFLHGALECHEYWYAPTHSEAWDTAAREEGFISFTPNFAWWGPSFSWPGAADQVADQLAEDFQGLRAARDRTPGIQSLPWDLVAHDMGGLAARVLTSGSHRSDAAVKALRTLYLLGTPNSGSDLLLGGGSNSLLSVNSVIRRFNEVYPDFGEKNGAVVALGGTADWWETGSSDGPLPVASAFNITRLACVGDPQNPTCTPYAYLAFDSGPGHLFDVGHYDLGSDATTDAILRGIILHPGRSSKPESPAGTYIWGTTARTSGTASGTAQGRAAATEYPFSIGLTDGMAIAAWVTGGSASLQVVDPEGNPVRTGPQESYPAEYPGFLFTRTNPLPGVWKLRILPGPDGASFSATAVENSLFGIRGILSAPAFYPGDSAPVRVELDGQVDGVTVTLVTATLFDAVGAPIQTITLTPSTGGYSGLLTSPSTAGSFPVTFEAGGTFGGESFVRTAYERLNVIPPPTSRARLFTGAFQDHGEDRDGSGKFDTVVFEAGVAPPHAGSYAFGADIYDAAGNWLAHASTQLEATSTSAATVELTFPLPGILCNQLASPLGVKNLTATDGVTLAPVDLWTSPALTGAYDPGSFDCVPSVLPPQPTPRTLRPDQGIRGMAYDLLLAGSNLSPSGTVDLGEGITVNGITSVAEGLLRVSISILPGATPGPRDLFITNPSVPRVGLYGAFEVRAASSPGARVLTPKPDQAVRGQFLLTASAWGDLRITQVEFFAGTLSLGSATSFPFQLIWDTTAAGSGPANIVAVAHDESGQSAASPPVRVCVNGLPGDCDCSGLVSIGEVQKAINMFLGSVPPDCGVDCSGDGTVSIGDVQKVINAFLGLPSSC